MPENWELLGCELTDGYEINPGTAAAEPDLEALRTAIQAAKEIREGYAVRQALLPHGEYSTLKATCKIIPKGECGRAELTYGIFFDTTIDPSTAPKVSEGEVKDCEEIYQNWLIQEGIVVLRAIECYPEAVPTVSGWGILVMSMLLAGSGAWYLLRHKRRA